MGRNTRIIRIHPDMEALLREIKEKKRRESIVDSSKWLVEVVRSNDILNMDQKIILFAKPRRRKNGDVF